MILNFIKVIYFTIRHYYYSRLNSILSKKKVGKSMSLCCTVGYSLQVGHSIMDGIKFEVNDILNIIV